MDDLEEVVKTCDGHAVDEVGRKLAPLGDAAGHDGGRCGCERELDQPFLAWPKKLDRFFLIWKNDLA